MQNTSIHRNFKTASWFENSKDERISILGAGGIGSNTAYNLAKSLQAYIILVDFDRVETHNIGSQFFWPEDEGKLKVAALHSSLFHVAGGHILAVNREITDQVHREDQYRDRDVVQPITIAGFDNMLARKTSYEIWKSRENKELFIDGRLRATQYEIFCVRDTEESMKAYEATLFDDADVPDDPCTFKQTAYAAMLLGAKITSFVINYLSNKYAEEEISSVPFFYKEVLELCYSELIDNPEDMPEPLKEE